MASPRHDPALEDEEPSAFRRSEIAAELPPSGAPVTHVGQTVPAARAPAPWVLLARLVRPHGRRGEIVAEILTDFPERFHQRTHLFLIPPERVASRPHEVVLENFWFLRSRIVLKFQAVDSINEAEGLRNFSVAIPAAERAPVDPGAVYVSDLIGCRVFDLNQAGLEVGEVIDVDRGSSNTDLLVVRRPGMRASQSEVLIPFVREHLVLMDVDNGRVEMRLPGGLLEINNPLTEEEKQQARGPID